MRTEQRLRDTEPPLPGQPDAPDNLADAVTGGASRRPGRAALAPP